MRTVTYAKVFFIFILLSIFGCASTDHRGIDFFEKYKVRKNHYEGVLNENTLSKDYVKAKWYVNGEGRAISAMIQLDDGKIIQHRVWSYDNFIEWVRKSKHKRMLLEALQWVN